MWWLIVLLLLVFLFSYQREGLDPIGALEPDDPSVRELLRSNKLAIKELTKKADSLTPLAEQVTSLTERLKDSNSKLDEISKMCMKCTA